MGNETMTRVILGFVFLVSIILMIIFNKLFKCPQCEKPTLKEEKKVRCEPIRFICHSCEIRWETDRIYTKKAGDHRKG